MPLCFSWSGVVGVLLVCAPSAQPWKIASRLPAALAEKEQLWDIAGCMRRKKAKNAWGGDERY